MSSLAATRRLSSSGVRQDLAVLGFLTLVAAVLGFWKIGSASVWLDEAASHALARAPFGDFLAEAAAKEANMSAYYLLLRPFLWLGDSEVALRLPSALAAIGLVPAVYAVARRVFSPRVGSSLRLWFQ